VVVDSRTNDNTAEIARRFSDRVWVEDVIDFASHKNAAIDRAVGEWLLIVDADERITPALASEITAKLASDPQEWAFEIETLNYFLGRRMRHGGWNEHHVRLIRRARASYVGEIHESFTIPPEHLGRLDEGMWHFSHRSIEEMLAKTGRFGGVQSRMMLESGAGRVTAWTLARVILRELAFRMIRRRGYRDGMPGLIEALYQPFSLLCVHAMLWQQQRQQTLWETYQDLERQAAEHR
jgi:glycosyltransferase involved in cell wall biosynthesis